MQALQCQICDSICVFFQVSICLLVFAIQQLRFCAMAGSMTMVMELSSDDALLKAKELSEPVTIPGHKMSEPVSIPGHKMTELVTISGHKMTELVTIPGHKMTEPVTIRATR